jgi:hypothetical protein
MESMEMALILHLFTPSSTTGPELPGALRSQPSA